ncbi:MAG: endonuclease/exonuclease/phosphatase family protein [Pseudomonadota bacterium]|nr:endonuclease/exonuclease/phosphatase family protein [Pseudomonadota bacterium]
MQTIIWLLVAIIVMTALGWMRSLSLWLDILADLKLQLAIIALLLSVVLFVFRRRKIALLSLLVGVVNGIEIPIDSPKVSEVASGLKIISFNVNNNNMEAKGLAEFLLKENADVIIFYELNKTVRKKLTGIAALYPHQYFSQAAPAPGVKPHGIGLISRKPWIAISEKWDTETKRTYGIQSSFRFNKRTLNLFGVHLSNPIFRHPRQQFSESSKLIKIIKSINGPLVLVGDFNMTPFSNRYKNFLKLTGLKSMNGNILSTWPAWLTPFGLSLDHIFTSHDIAISSVRTGSNMGSDHRSIIGIFRPEK